MMFDVASKLGTRIRLVLHNTSVWLFKVCLSVGRPCCCSRRGTESSRNAFARPLANVNTASEHFMRPQLSRTRRLGCDGARAAPPLRTRSSSGPPTGASAITATTAAGRTLPLADLLIAEGGAPFDLATHFSIGRSRPDSGRSKRCNQPTPVHRRITAGNSLGRCGATPCAYG